MEIGPGDMADGFESVTAGPGADVIVATFVDPGTPWRMVVDSGGGPDAIVITIEGGAASEGVVVLRTGSGDDTAVIDSWAPGEISAGDGSDEIVCGWGGDVAALGSGADVGRCRTGSDVVRGGPGHDGLHGGRGPDSLHGGSGRDVCFAYPPDSYRSCRRAR